VSTQVSSWLNFNPLSLNPQLWLDAADPTTITASGSPLRVSQWDDKSGNGRNLVQATAGNQPVSGATFINGLNVIDFISPRRLVRITDNILQDVGGATIYVVVRGTYSSGFGLFVNITANDAAAVTRAYSGKNSGTIISGGRRLDANAFQSVASASVADNTPVVAAGFYIYSDAQLDVSVNAVKTRRSGGFQTAGNTSNTASRILVGATDQGTEAFTGSIAEIIVTARVLTSSESFALENYLRTKWAVY
jgi:hypothetical protein